jgi:hypothetical protein
MPKQVLIPDDLKVQLLENGRKSAAGEEIDPPPVLKLFMPFSGATWLLTELNPEDPDIAFGLCDLGEPELGYVSISEIVSVKKMGMGVERDEHIRFDKPLSAYADQARKVGRIDTSF